MIAYELVTHLTCDFSSLEDLMCLGDEMSALSCQSGQNVIEIVICAEG